MNPFRIYSLVLGGAAIAFSVYFLLRRKPKTPEELERKRREWLDTVGRITDGTVIDVQELPFDGPPLLHHADLPVRCRGRLI